MDTFNDAYRSSRSPWSTRLASYLAFLAILGFLGGCQPVDRVWNNQPVVPVYTTLVQFTAIDAYTDSTQPNTNFSAGPFTSLTVGDVAAGSYHAYVEISFSAILAGISYSNIKSIRLRVRGTGSSFGGYNYGVAKVTGGWTALSAITHNNLPTTAAVTRYGFAPNTNYYYSLPLYPENFSLNEPVRLAFNNNPGWSCTISNEFAFEVIYTK